MISKRFKELDVAGKVNIFFLSAGKVNIKTKLQEIAFSDKTSIYTPHDKVKTKGVVKMTRPTKFMRSTKRISSYFEHVNFIHSQHNNCSSKKCNEGQIPQILLAQFIHLLD